jgi:NAD(P)-dependent dehydrogenase (short-subunit alcohol dehydrogenase family)
VQFATNHLGHFALTTGLHDALVAAGDARVVMVSSVGHINGEVLFDDVNFERHPYDPWAAYSQSKTANVLFMVEAAKRWAADHIAVNALNPGPVTGRYFEDCNEAGPHQPGVRRGVAEYALDPDQAARLWQLSTDLLTAAR